MGYQESFIYTSKSNVESNRQGIEKILAMFRKYNVRCADDAYADCVCRLHFNKRVSEFKKGMEMLVVCGERSAQRSPYMLFNLDTQMFPNELAGMPELTDEELKFIRKIKIIFIEERWDILDAEKTDAITVEKLELRPD